MKPFVSSVALIVLGLTGQALHAEDHAPAAAPVAAEQPASDHTPAEGEQAAPQEQPYQLVRTLEKMQDQIASGSSDAHGLQRQLIAEIGDKMMAADNKVWEEARNGRSAIVYVLSGGDPRVLQMLAKMEKVPDLTPEMIKGVLAYAEGRNRDALRLLTNIDHRALDTRIGGHLALTKAMVYAPEDAVKSLTLLDDARLLCPGTLVEEAALRRQVLLLASVENYSRFELLAFDYLLRFPKSVYARNFSRSFAVAVASSKMGEDPALIAQLEKRLDELSDDARRTIYMMLAEEGVTRGRVELTRLAADKIGYLIREGSRDAVRLQLYKAAALLVTKEYDFAVAKLNTIDRSKLGDSDRKLLDNALLLGVQVRQPLLVSGPITELPPLSSTTQVKHGDIAAKSEALDAARAVLSRADELLNREQK